ncbi:MAG: division/cell wall cluster transcriptional repressor MraZ [Thermoleophilia bacterium]|nr:division/cell wall cluster transcriptional repressor MraZ [Thermoleophilia bacterium]
MDSKNRVAIPAKFRSQISGGKVVVTKFFGGCLAVYPESEWQELVQNQLSSLNPITSREALRIERTLFGSAFPCEVDKQGRISLSAYHLKVAGIGKEVVFKGLNNKFEIWDKGRWEAWEEAEDQRYEQEE